MKKSPRLKLKRRWLRTSVCVALLSAAGVIFAQERPRTPQAKNRPATRTLEKKAPGFAGPDAPPGALTEAAPTGDSAANEAARAEEMRQIEESWMSTINGGNAPATPSATEPTAEGETQRFKNPGTSAPAESAGETTGAAAEVFGSKEEGPSFFSVVFRFLGLTALMILILYAGLRFLRARGGPLAGTGDLVQVVATVPLMQGRFLQIVDLAGQLLVLGVSDSGVHLVTEIEDSRLHDRIRLWQAERSRLPSPAGMLERLTGVLKNSEFRFWHQEGRGTEKSGPGFKEWLSRYAPAPGGTVAAEEFSAGAAEQESLSELLKSQRNRLSSLHRKT